MNLQQVKNENSRKTGNYISLGSRTGLISFSKDAIIDLKLVKGTKMMLLQDRDQPKDWYLWITPEGDIEYRAYKTHSGAFNSIALVKKIKESISNFSDKNVRIYLGQPFDDNGKTLIALLTARI
jgi:hypothetical protein